MTEEIKIFKTNSMDSSKVEELEKEVNKFITYETNKVIDIQYTANNYYFSVLVHYLHGKRS